MKKTSNSLLSSEMSVIWKKDKLQKYSKVGKFATQSTSGLVVGASTSDTKVVRKHLSPNPSSDFESEVAESITSPGLASGDAGAELQCRLCGASDHLQLITNDRLDETLRLYFGVQVPPEGVICDSCVKCMKITEGFSALVHASFNKTISEDSSRHTRILAECSPGATNLPATSPQKEILSLLKTKLRLESPRRKRDTRRKITKSKSNIVFKKMIIACTVCGQKYPMFMPDGGKKFVCSRCQKASDWKKITQPFVNKADLRCKSGLKGKARINLPKKPQQVKQNSATPEHLAMHHCSQCPKKYAVAGNLAAHVKSVHEDSFICGVSRKKLKSKDSLDKHLKEHSGNFQCNECVRVFKNNRALQTHLVSHDKQKVKSYSS